MKRVVKRAVLLGDTMDLDLVVKSVVLSGSVMGDLTVVESVASRVDMMAHW